MSDVNTALIAAFSANMSTIPMSQVARVSIGSIARVIGDSPEKLMKINHQFNSGGSKH